MLKTIQTNKKFHRPAIKNIHKIDHLFNNVGLVALQPSFITKIQLEVIIKGIKGILEKKGKIILRVFPHLPYTKKPLQSRMGKGKSPIVGWLQPVRPGAIILEIKTPSKLLAHTALKHIQSKLPFRSKIIMWSRLMARQLTLTKSIKSSNLLFTINKSYSSKRLRKVPFTNSTGVQLSYRV